MDDELRRKTEEILDELGLSMSAAVNILAHQIVRTRGIPFPLTLSDAYRPDRSEAAETLLTASRSICFEPEYKFAGDARREEEQRRPNTK
jgi:addiction module RelB/DinJ family antitoxin